ncbi:MAG TPA: hypothetical protein VGK67_26155 [Myxococcales bacterium]
MRFPSVIAFATLLLAAAPARAGWQRTQFVDSGGQPATPPALNLRAVGVGAGGKVWAVGGAQSTASFIAVSTDGFATVRQDASCASINRILNALWVAPDGSYVHAFGLGNAHAAWNGTSWDCANFTNPTGIGLSIGINGVAFSDSANGYLVGGATSLPTTSLVLQYASGTLTNVSNVGFGTATNIARSSSSGILDYSVGGRLFRHPQTNPFATVGSSITSLFLLGDSGLAAAGDAALTRKIDAAASTATAPSGTLMDFQPVLGVTMAPKGFALAVGQVSSANVSEGAIAQSDDGGDNWRRIDLSKISPAVKVLHAVACWDENNCVAVGANDLALTGGSGFDPEFLVYANHVPTVAVTVNGQPSPATVLDDADVTLTATVADPEGDPTTLTWYGPTPVDGSHAATVTFTPAVSCSAQNLPHAIEVTDGRLTTSPPIDVSILVNHAPKAPSAPALSPAPATGTTYEWAVGSTNTLTASATKDCGRPVTYEFQQTGAVPAPSIAGASATYDVPASGCGGGSGKIQLTISDRDDTSLSTAFKEYDVHVTEIVEAPEVSLDPGTAIEVAYGTFVDVTAQVGKHCSGTDPALFDFAWSCDPTATDSKLRFSNVTDPCGTSTINCSVTVTPKSGARLPTTVGFTVKLLASTVEGTVSIAPASSVALLPGQGVQVQASSNLCSPTYSWTCSCSGAPLSAPSPGALAAWKMTNPDPNCSGGSCTCEVTATSGAQAPKASIQFLLGQSTPATLVSVSYSGAQELQSAGESVTAMVQAFNACATDFDWSWTCTGTAAPTDPSTTTLVLVHPGGNCADVPVECTATAKPRNGPGAEGQGTVTATYQAEVSEDPTGVRIATTDVKGSHVVAIAEAIGPCPGQGEFRWTAWLASNPSVRHSSVGSRFEYEFPGCGPDVVQLEVSLVLAADAGTYADAVALPVDGAQGGAPVASFEGETDVQRVFVLGCEGPEALVLAPSAACGVRHWRQLDGPALPTRVLAGGELSLEPAPEAAGSLWGTESTFELVVTNSDGTSAPATAHVRFEPKKNGFVTLQHDADRRSATAGEPVFFTVTATTKCAAAYDGVMDLQLTLSGLELVPGACKVDGVGVEDPVQGDPDPAHPEQAPPLVFRGLRTPADRQVATTVTYYARRQASASGVVASRAVARLHQADRFVISRESDAGGRPPVKPTAIALSCNCTEAGGGPTAWLGLAALLTSVARRRRENPPC